MIFINEERREETVTSASATRPVWSIKLGMRNDKVDPKTDVNDINRLESAMCQAVKGSMGGVSWEKVRN